jgi:hypothetical protein
MGMYFYQRRVVSEHVPYIVRFGTLLGMFFCLFVMIGLLQKSFDNVLSISLLSSHLCNWCVWVAMRASLCFLSYLMIYLPRCRMGPLSGVSCIECHQPFWR